MNLKYLCKSKKTFTLYVVKLCAPTEAVVLCSSLVSGHIHVGKSSADSN